MAQLAGSPRQLTARCSCSPALLKSQTSTDFGEKDSFGAEEQYIRVNLTVQRSKSVAKREIIIEHAGKEI